MDRIGTVAVVGAGTIGASWAALFLAHGLDVVMWDPAPGTEERVRAFLSRAVPDARPAERRAEQDGTLAFASGPEEAAAGTDFIQESAPERIELKAELLARLERAAPAHAVVASSTTAFPHSAIAAKAERPERIIVAHPFNPPHLVPLVELVGPAPDLPALRKARDFYAGLGREPVILKKEAVGHLANRFQAAVMREALYCLEQGIADVEDIDRALRYGPGLRWAFMGPFQTYHLAGGSGGIRQYFSHLGESQVERWKSLGTPNLDDALVDKAVEGVEAMAGGKSVEALEAERDRALKALVNVLRATRKG
jgi:3-hydroxyacyl-CoA dehydrogenase